MLASSLDSTVYTSANQVIILRQCLIHKHPQGLPGTREVTTVNHGISPGSMSDWLHSVVHGAIEKLNLASSGRQEAVHTDTYVEQSPAQA
jgi:hypothetical protein